VKVGDLVKWGHPSASDYGLVAKLGDDCFSGEVYIEWFETPAHSGYYPIEHELLEVISESR
jgi:hypothetical protein